MDLTPYVESLRRELAVTADAGGVAARALAEQLVTALDSGARLTLLNALSAAVAEVTRQLAPGSVDIRLRGLDPEFVVTPPAAADRTASAGAVPHPADGTEGTTVRINLRLAAHLKSRVEAAAEHEGLSANAWLVRAVSTALPADDPRFPHPAPREDAP